LVRLRRQPHVSFVLFIVDLEDLADPTFLSRQFEPDRKSASSYVMVSDWVER